MPYVAHGRGYDGADCWGIVFLYYRDVLETPVPSYSEEMAGRGMACAAFAPLISAEVERSWREVPDPVPGSVALLRNGRHPTHVGIVLERRRLLHSEGPGASVIERLDAPTLKRRLVGFYRLTDAD